MKLHKNQKFLLAVIGQIALVLLLILFKFTILSGGRSVLLKIEPVDPRDPLRGDYVVFQYQISNPLTYSIQTYDENGKDIEYNEGDTVYVELENVASYMDFDLGGIAAIQNVSKRKPDGGIFIKGVVDRVTIYNDQFQNIREMRIKYGIEQYFIPEGTGQNINFAEKISFGLVKLDEDGNAVLKQVYVDGKEWP